MRIRRAVSIALVTLLIFQTTGLASLFLIRKVSAEPDAKMWVTPPTNIYEKGDTFTITIWLNDTVDPGGPYNIQSWALEIGYDSKIIDYLGATLGGYFSGYGTPYFFPPSAHTNPVALSALLPGTGPGPEGPGELVNVQFQVKENGRSIIDIENTQLYEFFETPVPLAPSEDGVFFTTYPRADFYFLPSTTATVPSGYQTPFHLSRDPFVNETTVFNATAHILETRFYGSYDSDTATQGNPTGSITNYVWDFGDGNVTPGNYPVITHSFNTSRTYTVNLTVTDNDGKSSWYSTSVKPVIRDVGISSIEPDKPAVSPGGTLPIKVNITNYGNWGGAEFVNVTLFYNDGLNDILIPYNVSRGLWAWSNVFERDPITTNPPRAFPNYSPPITLNYTWNTDSLPLGNYTIWANISQVNSAANQFLKDLYFREMDLNLANNLVTFGTVEISELHDIAVTQMEVTPTLKSPNMINYGISPVTVTIKVKNVGDFDETFNVTLHQDSTLLKEWTNVPLASNTSTILEYIWDTSALARGYYNLVAQTTNLTGEVDGGLTVDNKRSLQVVITSAPVATFTCSPSKPLVGETVNIDASASQAAPGWSISTYTWRINGTVQATYTTDTVQHRFLNRALYNVTLTVTDNAGISNSYSQLLRLAYLPVAQFAFSPTAPKVDGAVTFDASSSAPDTVAVAGDQITIYQWDFGDGAKATYTGANLTKTATHTYAVSGNFTVKLKVFDGEDLNATITKFVVVAKITSGVTAGMSAQTIQVGQSVTVSGKVTPARAGVQVSILYKTATTDWTLLQNVTSDQAGNYQYAWTINTAGNYTVKAQFAGDNKYTSSESTTAAVEVTTPPDYTLYIVAAIVIAVIAGVALYLVRRRK